MTDEIPSELTPEEPLQSPEVDISIPDMLLPPEPEEAAEDEVKDAVDVSFNFAFIGAGQGGSRMAETFHTLGYRKIAHICGGLL